MTLIFAFALAACGALPNPKPTHQPAAWQPPPRPPAAETKAAIKSAAPAPAPAPTDNVQAQSAATGTTVALVGGKPIDVSELLAQWMHQDSFAVIEQVNHLVVNHLVDLESGRLGLVIEPGRAEQAYKDTVVEFEKQIATKLQKPGESKKPAIKLDDYVVQYLGLEPMTFRNRLRIESERGLAAERVMRAHFLQNEQAIARLIAVKTEEELKLVQSELAAGTSFEDVARKHSADPSGKDGGEIAPILKANTLMGNLAFSVKEGEIAGPQYEKNAWLLLKVESRPKPLAGLWKEIGPAVEKSLSAHGIWDLEFTQWKAAMKERYTIDLSPLMRAAGEPVR